MQRPTSQKCQDNKRKLYLHGRWLHCLSRGFAVQGKARLSLRLVTTLIAPSYLGTRGGGIRGTAGKRYNCAQRDGAYSRHKVRPLRNSISSGRGWHGQHTLLWRLPRRKETSSCPGSPAGQPIRQGGHEVCGGVEEIGEATFRTHSLKSTHRCSMNFSIRIAAAVLLLTTSMSLSARDRSNARSMVIARYGIVATSHVQASVAGAKILERGGSA